MNEFKLSTPVAFIIFNRPDTTERVFTEIAKAKPPKLLVIGDGARSGREGEAEKVALCRAIIERVDWACELLTNYSEINLGCKERVSSGLDWVFEQVEEAIILEDDCLPNQTFFRFCEEMLTRYSEDQRISMVSGNNFQFGKSVTDCSYYFSKYTHIWGWASWRRAWRSYDVKASAWPQFLKEGWLDQVSANCGEKEYWLDAFNGVYAGSIDTWDYQWSLACFSEGSISIMPNINLISNIGFGENATHTFGESIYANLPTVEMNFPLTHPVFFLPNLKADMFTAMGMFNISWSRRLLKNMGFISLVRHIKRVIKSVL